jgi:HK97 family phage major capsid protein
MREDQKLKESAILAGGNSVSRSEQRELNKIGQRFSLVRGIQQVYRGKQLTGLEAEMTEEANREAAAAGLTFRGQLSIPSKLLTRAVGDTGHWGATDTTNDNGTQFVATNVGPAVEALRAQNVLEQAGCTVLNGLTADLKIPKMTAGANIAEKGEAVDADSSAQALGQTLLQPRRATAFTLVTEQLMMQGGAAVESLVVRDLSDAVVQQIEKFAFIDILDGIAANSDNVETALGASSSVMRTLEENALLDGVNRGNIRIVANPRAHGVLATHSDVSAVTAAMVGNEYMGYPYLVGGNMPDDATATNEYGGGVVIMGDFSRGAVIGYFGGVDVVINPYTYDISNQVRISIHRHFDSDVLQAGALHARYETGS